MKRRLFAVAAVIMLMLTVSAQAVEPRAVGVPVLTFDGTTAECSTTCIGDSTTDKVKATLTLYQGSTVVDSWSNSGTYRVRVSGSCSVKSGKSYDLVLTWSINGVKQPTYEVTNICP